MLSMPLDMEDKVVLDAERGVSSSRPRNFLNRSYESWRCCDVVPVAATVGWGGAGAVVETVVGAVVRTEAAAVAGVIVLWSGASACS